MGTTRPGSLGTARHITGPERDKIRAELREGYLAGATIQDLAKQIGRSSRFVSTLLCEAGVVLPGRGSDRTQRDGLHNTDLFDWLALRRADTGSVSKVGRCYLDHGRRAPCYLPAALDRLVEDGLLELVEQYPGRARVVLTALGRTRFDQLNRRAAVRQ